MINLCRNCSVALLALAFVFAATSSANAQINIPAYGESIAQPTANAAATFAELDYFVEASAIASSPPIGHVLLGIDNPTVTVFPNSDGTFDAIATGFVRFTPSNPGSGNDDDWGGW